MSDHASQDDNRYAPPRAVVDEPLPVEGQLEPASRGQRFGGAFIDGLVAMAISIPVLIAMYGTQFFVAARGGPTAMLGGVALYAALYLALQSWFLYTAGQTLGKKAMGTRIVRADGSRADFPRLLFLRQGLPMVVNLIPFVGKLLTLVDVLFIFGAPRRCVHDYIADTVVVSAASSRHAVLQR
ncbi:MAG: RDD family protein [Burkholderiaceae bacterium]